MDQNIPAPPGSSNPEEHLEVTEQAVELRIGVGVRLHSLKGAPELNGKTATCGDFNDSSGRWTVTLESGEHKNVKPDNLEAIRPAASTLALSEQSSTDVEHDTPTARRSACEKPDSSEKEWKPESRDLANSLAASTEQENQQVSPTGYTVCMPSCSFANPGHIRDDLEDSAQMDQVDPGLSTKSEAQGNDRLQSGWSTSTPKSSTNAVSQAVFTSEERPLTVACINLPPLSGELDHIQRMVGFCMALGRTKQKDGYAWARDLQQDIMRLKDEYQANVLVTMMPKEELISIGGGDLPQLIQEQGIEWLNFEVTDKFVPTQGLAAFKKMAAKLAQRLRTKQRVVVHCNGGKGRSAMMTAAVVHAYTQGTDAPLSMEEAIAKVRDSSSGALRNPMQVAYLYSCDYDPGKFVSVAKHWLRNFSAECT